MRNAVRTIDHPLTVEEVFLEKKLDPSREVSLSKSCFDIVGPLALEFVFSDRFRVSDEPKGGKLFLLRFAHEPSTDEVILALKQEGLAPPHEEDALRFAIAFADKSYNTPVVFLHTDNLWRVPGSREQVCVVDLHAQRRLYTIWHKNMWGSRYVFAARQSSLQPPH